MRNGLIHVFGGVLLTLTGNLKTLPAVNVRERRIGGLILQQQIGQMSP